MAGAPTSQTGETGRRPGFVLVVLLVFLVTGCAGSNDRRAAWKGERRESYPPSAAAPGADFADAMPSDYPGGGRANPDVRYPSGPPPDILGKCIGRHNTLRRHNPAAVTPEAIGYRFGTDLGGWRYIRFQDIRTITAIKVNLRQENWRGYQVLIGSGKALIPIFVDKDDKRRLVDALTRRAYPPDAARPPESHGTQPEPAAPSRASNRI